MARWHLKPKRFAGEMRLGSEKVALRFGVGIDANGVAKISIDEMPWDMATKFIADAYYDQAKALRFFEFELSGRARDGTTFYSDSAQILNMDATSSYSAPSTIKPRPWCPVCKIILPGDPNAPSGVKAWLRGFRCFQPIIVQSPLGRIELRGPMSIKPGQKSRMTGALLIEGPAPDVDFESWRSQAGSLFKHALSIMSFARGVRTAAPAVETVRDGKIEMDVKALMEVEDHGMGAFSPFDYASIFKQAVASHFFEGARRKEIDVAIEWFNMPASYREAKLTSTMTVLENLLTKNLEPEDLTIRSKSQAKKIQTAIVAAARRQLVEFGTTDAEIEDELRAMRPKLEDLNRRALKEKIRILGRRWGVPLDDISSDDLGAMIHARNSIVHEGQYTPGDGAKDLMWRVRLAREVVVRFVLAALQFEGNYTSPLTGERDRSFKVLASREE